MAQSLGALPTADVIGWSDARWTRLAAASVALRDAAGADAALTVGALTVTGVVNNGTPTTFGNIVIVQGNAATSRYIAFRTGAASRWILEANSVPESGADAGTNLDLYRYNDAGTFLGTVLSITRSTGLVTFNSGVQFGGDILALGGLRMVGDLTLRSSAGPRWLFRVGGAESAGNVGSLIELQARANDETYIDSPITIVRAAGGAMTLARPIVATRGFTSGDTSAVAEQFMDQVSGGVTLRLTANGTTGVIGIGSLGAHGIQFRTAGVTRGSFSPTGSFEVAGPAGINGKAGVANVAAPAAATDLATVIALANDIRTRLINFGIYT